MEPGAVTCAPLMGFMLGGSDKPISDAMIAPAMSSAKKIMRLAKPKSNPTPTSIDITPTHPRVLRLRKPGGKAGLTIPASNAPRASRNCTGKLAARKQERPPAWR